MLNFSNQSGLLMHCHILFGTIVEGTFHERNPSEIGLNNLIFVYFQAKISRIGMETSSVRARLEGLSKLV